MSDYHALEVSAKRDKVKVAFHFVVPDEVNATGEKNVRTCLIEDLTVSETPLTRVPNHATDFDTENAELVAGSKIEVVETLEFDANLNNASKLAIIEARYTALEAVIAEKVRQKYRFWGYNGDVT